MAEKQFYTAIDLGTTNSVIAYGNITRGRMKPIVLELDRKNDTGSTSRSPLLPSVAFYYRNKEGKIGRLRQEQIRHKERLCVQIRKISDGCDGSGASGG